MAEQLHFGFPGFEDGSSTGHLFFALCPPKEPAERVAGLAQHLRREHQLGGKLIPPPRLHISLHALGHSVCGPRDLVAAAHQAAAAVLVPQFEVVFDRVMSFDCKRKSQPFVLLTGNDATSLVAFHGALGEAMIKAGLGRWVRMNFTPHMTLLYDRRMVSERSIEPVRWTVRDFVLVHSLVGLGQHDHLAHWQLPA